MPVLPDAAQPMLLAAMDPTAPLLLAAPALLTDMALPVLLVLPDAAAPHPLLLLPGATLLGDMGLSDMVLPDMVLPALWAPPVLPASRLLLTLRALPLPLSLSLAPLIAASLCQAGSAVAASPAAAPWSPASS